MLIVLMFVISFGCSALAAINCPASWSDYKTAVEVSFRYSSMIRFIVNRKIRYHCDDDNVVKFYTTLTAQNYFADSLEIAGDISETCDNCESTLLKITARYRNRESVFDYYAGSLCWSDWIPWTDLPGTYFYSKRNCDKLYWTNWIETTNCASSSKIILKRSCADCDGDALEQKYCDATGHAVNKTTCNHFWGNWTEEPWVTTGCNTVGERVRTRQCLYDNGREAIDVGLCSDDHESAVMKEKCYSNSTIPVQCVTQSSSAETGNAVNMSFYVGIGVAVALIVILCILLVIMRYHRHKPAHFPPADIANPSQTSPYEFENVSIKTEQQSDDVLRPVEISQQNPAVAHRFASPTVSTNNRLFKSWKPRAQDNQGDKLGKEPVASEIAQIKGSNVYELEQAPNQDTYAIETPGVSNAYEIASPADQNVYEIEDSLHHAQCNFAATHSIKGNPEQIDTYSSLQSSSDVVESTYSKLER